MHLGLLFPLQVLHVAGLVDLHARAQPDIERLRLLRSRRRNAAHRRQHDGGQAHDLHVLPLLVIARMDHIAAMTALITVNVGWVGSINPATKATDNVGWVGSINRSEEHTSELQSLMRISYAVFCLKKKKTQKH